jgi:hypothetical protein
MDWLAEAYTTCGGTAAYLGAVLWHLSGMKQNALTFPVSNIVVGNYGFTRQTKHDALKKLAATGLVRLEKHGNRAKTVTIVVTE